MTTDRTHERSQGQHETARHPNTSIPSTNTDRELIAELIDLLDDVTIYTVEEDERVHLRIGHVFIAAFLGIKAATLLKFDAEQRALLGKARGAAG